VMCFVMGLYPKPFLNRMEPSVLAYLDRMHQKMAAVEVSERQAQSQKAEGHNGWLIAERQ
jgi:hypothetical protein